MGMEVAGSEIVHGNGGIRVQSCLNPHEKENRKLHGLGSHGANETAKANGAIVLNGDLPKDVADKSPEERKVHSFYVVKYRAYDKPDLKAKIDQADKEIWKKNHQRVRILDRIKAKRLDRAQIIEQLRSLGQERRQYATVVDEKLNQMKPFKDALGSLWASYNASRNKAQHLNYRTQHEVISLSKEKQLMGTRDKDIYNAAMRAKIQELMGQKEATKDQVTLKDADLNGMMKESVVVKSRVKQLEDELKVLDGDIGSLQLDLTSILEKRDKAVETIYELRKERDRKNACFFQNCNLLNYAKDLAAEKNIKALKELSCREVEKFMTSWNSSSSFRDDYEKRISASLEFRQLSRDGRIRNPDVDPMLLAQHPNKPAEAQPLAKAAPNPAKQDSEPVKEQENINIPAERESKRKQEEPKTAVKLNNVEDDEDYYIVELPKKENKIDEATLKEIRRLEEMEKQRQAMERKKKLAEKAAAKAAIRAQKEAEKKQKEREKKLKKKESFSAAEAEKIEKGEENVKKPNNVVTGKTKEAKDASSMVSVRARGRTKGGDSIAKVILKRKRSNKYLIWVAASAVVVGVILALIFN